MRHTERLQKLIDLTSTLESYTYLNNELRLLQHDINISISDAKIQVLKELNL